MIFEPEKQIGRRSSSEVLKIIILVLFAVIMSIVSASFAANHLRISFEKEYNLQVTLKTQQLASACSLMISGDEIAADPVIAQTKYSTVLPALLIDSGEKNQSRKVYGLYAYTNGSLVPLLQSNDTGLLAMVIPVSLWLTPDSKAYTVQNPEQTTVLTPIKDSQGKVVALFELSSTYTFLDDYGKSVERMVLMSVLVAVTSGLILFSLQYLTPEIVKLVRKRGDKY